MRRVRGIGAGQSGKIPGMTTFPAPTEADIQRVVDLVVETVSPLRIVLFGSAARGELRDGSDVDMMVVVPDGVDELRTAQALYRVKSRAGITGVPVDFVVTTVGRYLARQDSVGSVYREVARDGRELYAA